MTKMLSALLILLVSQSYQSEGLEIHEVSYHEARWSNMDSCYQVFVDTLASCSSVLALIRKVSLSRAELNCRDKQPRQKASLTCPLAGPVVCSIPSTTSRSWKHPKQMVRPLLLDRQSNLIFRAYDNSKKNTQHAQLTTTHTKNRGRKSANGCRGIAGIEVRHPRDVSG